MGELGFFLLGGNSFFPSFYLSHTAYIFHQDDTHLISLRLIPDLQSPPPVQDHDVPVAVTDLDALVRRSPNLDLTISRVVQYIDGISYTKKIALESGVSLELVRKALQHLMCVEVVAMSWNMFFLSSLF